MLLLRRLLQKWFIRLLPYSWALCVGCGGTYIDGASCEEAVAELTLLRPTELGGLGAEHDESTEAGMQTSFLFQTNMKPGAELTLSQSFPSGLSILHEIPGIVADDGTVLFTAVSLEEGEATLKLHAEGRCDWLVYEEAMQVQKPAGCELRFPMVSRDGVNYLGSRQDNDAQEPGAQFFAQIVSLPGASVSLMHQDEGQLINASVMGSDGSLDLELNLQEGLHELEVECQLENEAEPYSTRQSVLVDTITPRCDFDLWRDGDIVTRSLDEDFEHDGTQVTFSFQLGEIGIKPSDISISVLHDEQKLSAPSFMLIEPSVAEVQLTFWGPGENQIEVNVQDEADNLCESSLTVFYSPTAP